jgi:hypothetical protein
MEQLGQPAPSAAGPAHAAPDGTVPIESGWALALDVWAGSDDGTTLSTSSADTAGWVSATVPGTVLASLVDQGHFPDPVAGFNNLRIPEALSRHSWWYRRSFDLPSVLTRGLGRHVWLEFDGINHQAEIWLNGTQVGELTHPFARGAFDVTSALSGGEQVLAVRITPMPHPGNPGDKGPSGVSFVNPSLVSLDFPSYISVSGWDWMPAVRDRVAGIWNHVRLRSTGPAVLGDPRVDTSLPRLPDTSLAEVTVVVPVRNASATTQAVTVRAAFGDVQVSTTVSVPGNGDAEVTFFPADFPALRVSSPRLWWPNGYGEPDLYDLVMTASVGGAESDRRTRPDRQYAGPRLRPAGRRGRSDRPSRADRELPAAARPLPADPVLRAGNGMGGVDVEPVGVQHGRVGHRPGAGQDGDGILRGQQQRRARQRG